MRKLVLAAILLSSTSFAGMPIDDLFGLYLINVKAQPGVINLVTLSAPNKVFLEEYLGKISNEPNEACEGTFSYTQETGTVVSNVQCKNSGRSFTQTVVMGKLTQKQLNAKPRAITVASSLLDDVKLPATAQRVRMSE